MGALLPSIFYRLGGWFGLGTPTARQAVRANAGATEFELFDTGSATNIVSGTLAVANGGTNLALYAVGDLVYASGTTMLAKLADVATGSVLVSGGVGVAPAWATHDTAGLVSKSGTQTSIAGDKTWTGNQHFTGSVGIGVFPTVKFQIKNSGGFGNGLLVESTGSTSYSSIDYKNSAGGYFQTGLYGPSATDASGAFFFNTAGGGVTFYTGGSGNPATDLRFQIATGGNFSFRRNGGSVAPSLFFEGASTNTYGRRVGSIVSAWATDTDASRKGRVTLNASDAAGDRECVRIESDGGAGYVGIGGAIDTASKLAVEGTIAPKSYTVATLPTAGTARRIAYASNGRKAGEGAAAGTGVLVFDDATNWIAVDTGAAVAA